MGKHLCFQVNVSLQFSIVKRIIANKTRDFNVIELQRGMQPEDRAFLLKSTFCTSYKENQFYYNSLLLAQKKESNTGRYMVHLSNLPKIYVYGKDYLSLNSVL